MVGLALAGSVCAGAMTALEGCWFLNCHGTGAGLAGVSGEGAVSGGTGDGASTTAGTTAVLGS